MIVKKLNRENKSYSGYIWITDDGLARVGDSTKEGRVGNAEDSHEGTGGAVQNNMRLSPSTATQRPRGILYQVSWMFFLSSVLPIRAKRGLLASYSLICAPCTPDICWLRP